MTHKTDGRVHSAETIRLTVTWITKTGQTNWHIARRVQISDSSVRRIRQRVAELGIENPEELNALSDQELQRLFYPELNEVRPRLSSIAKLTPDYQALAKKLSEERCTPDKLYEEYRGLAQEKELKPFSASYFKARLRETFQVLCGETPESYLAQEHIFGQNLEIDFTGDSYQVLTCGGKVKCWILVLCWSASHYVYAEFVTSQSTSESCRVIGNAIRQWHLKAPAIITCDNAKCFVVFHKGIEAIYNRSFADFIHGMGICIEAAPPYRPQRKSAAENAVHLTQILAGPLRTYFESHEATLTEHNRYLNQQINENINRGSFRGSSEKTREYLFLHRELPACMTITAVPEYREDLRIITVPKSYHIEIEQHLYSVPSELIGKRVDVEVTNDLVIVKFNGQEVARHLRHDGEGKTTVEAHMPTVHQEIVKKERMYKTADDVLRISKDIDEGVYRFCLSRVKRDRERGISEKNTISCCRAVINAYKRSPEKQLFSEACISTLALPSELWNSYKVREVYGQVVREFLRGGHVQHQTEIFRADESGAHLRDSDAEPEDTEAESQPAWYSNDPD